MIQFKLTIHILPIVIENDKTLEYSCIVQYIEIF